MPGGGVSQGFEEFGPYDPAGWGEDLCPPRRRLLMPRIGQELLDADPPVRLIMVVAGNPVNMAPNSAKVAEAFERTECVVYVGHFLDDGRPRPSSCPPPPSWRTTTSWPATATTGWDR